MPKKRKTLPKDIREVLKSNDFEAITSILQKCEIDAYSGHSKKRALSFSECSPEIARWLVSQGNDIHIADIYYVQPIHEHARWSSPEMIQTLVELGADVNAAGRQGEPPLHCAAYGHKSENVEKLIELGADISFKNIHGDTALEGALAQCANAQLDQLPPVVEVLIAAGAAKTERAQEHVRNLGETFEFYAPNFNPDTVDDTRAALNFLYTTFDVTPVPSRKLHDGEDPIVIKSDTWQKAHAELWDLLVPGSGPAQTMQGEAVRIAGRIADEWHRNGGANWDSDYRAMAKALVRILARGNPLSDDLIGEASAIVNALNRTGGEGDTRLAELTVMWVRQNLDPMPTGETAYDR